MSSHNPAFQPIAVVTNTSATSTTIANRIAPFR
jgi:hypothetical protein